MGARVGEDVTAGVGGAVGWRRLGAEVGETVGSGVELFALGVFSA